MLASPFLSWDAFIWLFFEDSKDVSFGPLDMPQICAFNFMKLKKCKWGLKVAAGGQFVYAHVGLWPALSIFDEISSEKSVL